MRVIWRENWRVQSTSGQLAMAAKKRSDLSSKSGNYILNLIASQAVVAPSSRSENRPVTITPLSTAQQQALVATQSRSQKFF